MIPSADLTRRSFALFARADTNESADWDAVSVLVFCTPSKRKRACNVPPYLLCAGF